MLDYSPTLTDHFLNPRNRGALDEATALGEAGAVRTGDALRLTLKIGADGVIAAAGFETTGGGPEIATASALTELVIGKSVAEARSITADYIETVLGGLPAEDRSAVEVAEAALKAALADYAQPPAFRAARGPRGTQPLSIAPLQPTAPAAPAGKALSAEEESAAVLAVLDEMRPRFRADGGDVDFVDIVGPRVRVILKGNCSGCQLAGLTLGGLQKRLAEVLGRTVLVVPAPART